MVARSGVVFLASMAAILTNPMEIRFGSFTMTSTLLVATTSSVSAVKIATTPIATSVSDLASEPQPPKPYDIVQGMEHVISIMEDTLQICERAQCSTQMAPCYGTFPFGLRPHGDIYTR
jgi:hypothetical protein